MLKAGFIDDDANMRLLRQKHIDYVTKYLLQLPAGYVSLDARWVCCAVLCYAMLCCGVLCYAMYINPILPYPILPQPTHSRAWIIYWLLHALYLLGAEATVHYTQVLSQLSHMQNATGGCGAQACVCVLGCVVGVCVFVYVCVVKVICVCAHYTMLCYAMLCCAMLCYTMLCYAILCCAVLCYTIPCYRRVRGRTGAAVALRPHLRCCALAVHHRIRACPPLHRQVRGSSGVCYLILMLCYVII
jgi:hypothetical protein